MSAPLTHLYFFLILLASVLLPRDSNALNIQCMRRIFVNQYETSVPVNIDLGVIDIGSSTVKLFLKKGSTGEVFAQSYVIDLGKSLGRSGSIDESAYQSLKTALEKAKNEMKLHQFSQQNVDVVATAGLRDASNGKQIIANLKKDGLPVRLLSEKEEAGLVYRAVMKNQKLSWQAGAVIEVGGGSTEIAFGKSFLDLDLEKTAVIPAGSGSLAIQNPFDAQDILKASQKTRDLLRQTSAPATVPAIEEAFLGRPVPMRVLRDLHLAHSGKDIFETGLTKEFLDEYLSPHGLANLKLASTNPLYSQYAEVISQIPSKLVVLREAMQHYRFPILQFGSGGGMKEAVAIELEAKIVGKQIDRAASRMTKQWMAAKDDFSDKMTELFDPADFGKWEFRVKQHPSVENKLTSKWVKGTATMEKLKTPAFSHEFIGDGIGGRLTLDHAGVQDLDQFYKRMLQSIRNKDIRITEIHNYRAVDGTPYLSDAQTKTLAKAVEDATGVKPIIKNGAEAEKTSGYTALHFNLIDAKGLQFEIQVRGEKVSRLAEFEHHFYDLRQGKGLSTADPKLAHAVANLTETQESVLLQYIGDYYRYARKLEQHQLAVVPAFPKELSIYPNLSLESALH